MLGSGRTILVLSDDSASVYTAVAGRYDLVGDVRWQDVTFVTRLTDLLQRQGKSNSVVILYDMVEQYYRKEVVPKVAVFDQRNVLDRRLASAFPNYKIRASLALSTSKATEEAVKTQAGLPGKGYLFTAVPETDQIARVTESVRDAMVSSPGIFLLPIESVSMVEQLSERLNQGPRDGDCWTVFISQHRGGGLRQIVVRNGELALTRLSPVIDTDIEPHIWASEVAQEFNATMGYLSRFGYSQDSELEVIAIGGAKGVAELEDLLKAPNFHGLDVGAAARLLKLNVRTDESLRYGDILHVGWAAKKAKFTLPMHSQDLQVISKGRQAGIAVAAVSTLLMFGAVGSAGYQGYTLYQATQDLQTKRQRLVQLENEYQAELKRKEQFNIDVKLVQGTIAIYDRLEKGRIDLIEMLRQIALSMNDDMRFDDIQMRYDVEQTPNPDPMAVQLGERKTFVMDLTMDFPKSVSPEEGNKLVSDLRDRIAQRLQNYTVSVARSVRDLTMNAAYTYSAGINVNQVATVDSGRGPAKITIRQKQDDQTSGP